jgi:hypothetical protein
MTGVSRNTVADGHPEIRAARAFAEQDVRAYIQTFVAAAHRLQNEEETDITSSARTCLLVVLYRHVVGMRLKHLTISAAQHLQKPLTYRHIGIIHAFTFQQLWSNLTLMLDQIALNAAEESPLPLAALEDDVRYAEGSDLGLSALQSLALRPGGQCSKAVRDEPSPQTSPLEVATRLEHLSQSLVKIEDWVARLTPVRNLG